MGKINYISKRWVNPLIAGASCYFYLPTARRVILENPKGITNPNHENDLEKFYWRNSPRSAITTTLGAVTGAYFIADNLSSGLLTMLSDKNPKELFATLGVVAATNFLSLCYEYSNMPKNRNSKQTQP